MSFLIFEQIDIEPLLKAEATFRHFLAAAVTDQEKTGAIKAFEICYELAWKLMKRILQYRGIDVASPREVFRQAGVNHLIEDVEAWLEFLQVRNMTVHTYNENVLHDIFDFLPQFSVALIKFVTVLKSLK